MTEDRDHEALALCRSCWADGLFAIYVRATAEGGAMVVAPTHIDRSASAQVLRQVADRIESGDFEEQRRQ